MATTNTPIWPQTIKSAYAVTSAANTTITDSANNTALLLTATTGADGGQIRTLSAFARGTNTATVLRVYRSKDAGTTQRLINSVAVAAQTIDTTAAGAVADFGYTEAAPLLVEAGDSIYVGSSVALTAGWSWNAEYEEF